MIYTGNKEAPLDKDLQAEYMQMLGGAWVGRCAQKAAVQWGMAPGPVDAMTQVGMWCR